MPMRAASAFANSCSRYRAQSDLIFDVKFHLLQIHLIWLADSVPRRSLWWRRW